VQSRELACSPLFVPVGAASFTITESEEEPVMQNGKALISTENMTKVYRMGEVNVQALAASPSHPIPWLGLIPPSNL
jgi:hypothetical protein